MGRALSMAMLVLVVFVLIPFLILTLIGFVVLAPAFMAGLWLLWSAWIPLGWLRPALRERLRLRYYMTLWAAIGLTVVVACLPLNRGGDLNGTDVGPRLMFSSRFCELLALIPALVCLEKLYRRELVKMQGDGPVTNTETAGNADTRE